MGVAMYLAEADTQLGGPSDPVTQTPDRRHRAPDALGSGECHRSGLVECRARGSSRAHGHLDRPQSRVAGDRADNGPTRSWLLRPVPSPASRPAGGRGPIQRRGGAHDDVRRSDRALRRAQLRLRPAPFGLDGAGNVSAGDAWSSRKSRFTAHLAHLPADASEQESPLPARHRIRRVPRPRSAGPSVPTHQVPAQHGGTSIKRRSSRRRGRRRRRRSARRNDRGRQGPHQRSNDAGRG